MHISSVRTRRMICAAIVLLLALTITSPAQTLTTLYIFTGGTDGSAPYAGLVQGADGNFYGTTSGSFTTGSGTVFQITPSGILTTLYNFTGGTDGADPLAVLVQGPNGNFYGTTTYGGTQAMGTVFQITPGGVLTTLYSFTGGTDGGNPLAGLVQGSDGNFYGTTLAGGTGGAFCSFPLSCGTVFQITPSGTSL